MRAPYHRTRFQIYGSNSKGLERRTLTRAHVPLLSQPVERQFRPRHSLRKMNKILLENIETQQKVALANLTKCVVAQLLLSSIEFSDSIDFNLYGETIWIIAKDRSDVEKILALAPAGKFWAKCADDTHGASIRYHCEVSPGVKVNLFAVGDALPPTCKLVEEEVTIPAQPERKEMRRVLKCAGAAKQPEQVAPPEVVADEIPVTVEHDDPLMEARPNQFPAT